MTKHDRLASQSVSATVAAAAAAAAAVAVTGGKRAFSSMNGDQSGGDAVSKVAESVQPEEEQPGEMARLLVENEALRMQMKQQGRSATSSR